ncbi:MAG TPA: hypothetical protein VKH37_11975 [Ferruginibacter sp.]|nr:hypothetical protein [Ferruginibacter sp.]
MKKIFCFGIATMFLVTACNNTQLISSWKAPEATADSYNKILVIGMTGTHDREMRESIENALASRLNAQGISTETSSGKFGPRSFRTMSEEEAVRTVNDNGFDGVMVVALLDKNQENRYTPGYITSTPYAVVRNRWYGNYTVLYDRVYNPGYYTTTTDYTLEADFYQTRGDKLIYSAQARSFDPNSSADLAGDFSKTVVKDMINKGIIMAIRG